MSLLEVGNISGGYRVGDYIVQDVSLSVDAGEVLTIIGPNGAGKSTFLKLVSGVLPSHAGRVKIDGDDYMTSKLKPGMSGGLAFVPQEHNIFPSMTVEENLKMGCFISHSASRARINEIYSKLPALYDRRRASGASLSGGQRQLLAVGAALMAQPRVLALDEPTAGLSPKAATEMFKLIAQLAADGLAVLMVEQNAAEALDFSHRAAVLVDGRKVREGGGSEFAVDPNVRRLFLGDD